MAHLEKPKKRPGWVVRALVDECVGLSFSSWESPWETQMEKAQ